jgi:hypothetical protein
MIPGRRLPNDARVRPQYTAGGTGDDVSGEEGHAILSLTADGRVFVVAAPAPLPA